MILVLFALSKQHVLTTGSAGESAEFLNFNEAQFIDLFPFMDFFFLHHVTCRTFSSREGTPAPCTGSARKILGHVLSIILKNSLPVLRI